MEFSDYLKFVLALGVVIGLILLTAAALKHYGARGFAHLSPRRRDQRRLQVVETLPVDPRRRLVLVRRDGVEHLLLIGGGSDLVLERLEAPIPSPPSSPAGDPAP